jgi:hypothetical protein
MAEAPKIGFRWRLLLLLAAWCAAAAVTVLSYPPLLRDAVVFPYGLMTVWVWLFDLKPQQAPHFLVGWLVYLVLSVAALVTGRRVVYFVVYALLCLLLALNAVGCHMMFHGYPKS